MKLYRSRTRGTRLGPDARVGALIYAQDQLRDALKAAKVADAPLLAGKIRSALKSSCGGAIRHAELAPYREERQAQAKHERSASHA